MTNVLKSFIEGLKHGKDDASKPLHAHDSKNKEREVREKQIDKTLKDSFLASDPPGGY